jgi:hypothetical protein
MSNKGEKLIPENKESFYQIPYSPKPQYIILIIFFLVLYHSQYLNKYFDEKLKKYPQKQRDIIKYTILSIPLLAIIVPDMLYHSFSMNNLGVSKVIPNEYLNYLLKVIGIYGIVQVLSQDFGMKTGLKQNLLTKNPVVHFICTWGAGFAVSGQRSESFIGALIYIFLKRVVSNNVLTEACFDPV